MTGRPMGVEEELLLVDPDSGEPSGMSGAVLRAGEPDALDSELHQEQVEIGTHPVRTPTELLAELRRWRGVAVEAAGRTGTAVAAIATSPLPVSPHASVGERYDRIIEQFGLTAAEQLTCGCHVHVEVASLDEGVAVIDRIGPWLPVLRAASANSPYWQGRDSGYASYRSEVWGRWPSAGPTAPFGSLHAYRDTVRAMVDTETVLDTGQIYFDARLSEALSTVEIRVADVMTDVEDVVVLAALARALVSTAARGHDDDVVTPGRGEVLRLAHWRASRTSLAERLIDPRTGRAAAAGDVVWALRDHVHDALVEAGDDDLVTDGLERLLRTGTGAARQRTIADDHHGDLRAIVHDAVARTRPA